MLATRRDQVNRWLEWCNREGVRVTVRRDDWFVFIQRFGRRGEPEPAGLIEQGKELKADIIAVLTGADTEGF